MQLLSIAQTEEVSGGFLGLLVSAILVGVSVFIGPNKVRESVVEYGEQGQDWSQQYWDNNYPYDPNYNGCYGPSC